MNPTSEPGAAVSDPKDMQTAIDAVVREMQEGSGTSMETAQMEFAAREIIRLREIVAKLPTTADGVKVGPGTIVYHAEGFAVIPGCVGDRAPIYLTNGISTVVCACYSTPEAARAAKERTK